MADAAIQVSIDLEKAVAEAKRWQSVNLAFVQGAGWVPAKLPSSRRLQALMRTLDAVEMLRVCALRRSIEVCVAKNPSCI